MNEILPINKDVFIWARTSIGLSIEEVAHKLNKNPREIEEWEKGNASPTYLQLEHLAHDIYKRQILIPQDIFDSLRTDQAGKQKENGGK